jgi:hypothetical protein
MILDVEDLLREVLRQLLRVPSGDQRQPKRDDAYY